MHRAANSDFDPSYPGKWVIFGISAVNRDGSLSGSKHLAQLSLKDLPPRT